MQRRIAIAVFVFVLIAPSVRAQPGKVDLNKLPPPAREKMDFLKDIKPLFFKAKCYQCHSGVVVGNFSGRRGGFALKDRETALRGGDSGVVIVPGNSAASRLILAVAGIDPEI